MTICDGQHAVITAALCHTDRRKLEFASIDSGYEGIVKHP